MLAAANAAPRIPYLSLTGLSLQDRLLYSGRVLLDFDIYNWLGIKASRTPTADAGYAYVISNVGLLGFAAFWFWFMSLDGRSRYFYAFRNTSAAYFAALFCVSAVAIHHQDSSTSVVPIGRAVSGKGWCS